MSQFRSSTLRLRTALTKLLEVVLIAADELLLLLIPSERVISLPLLS